MLQKNLTDPKQGIHLPLSVESLNLNLLNWLRHVSNPKPRLCPDSPQYCPRVIDDQAPAMAKEAGYGFQTQLVSPLYEINWNGMKWMSMGNLKAKMCFFSLGSRQFWWTYPEVWDYAALLFRVNLTALQKTVLNSWQLQEGPSWVFRRAKPRCKPFSILVILIDFVWSCFFGCTMEKDAASHHGDLIRQCLIKNSSASGSRS